MEYNSQISVLLEFLLIWSLTFISRFCKSLFFIPYNNDIFINQVKYAYKMSSRSRFWWHSSVLISLLFYCRAPHIVDVDDFVHLSPHIKSRLILAKPYRRLIRVINCSCLCNIVLVSRLVPFIKQLYSILFHQALNISLNLLVFHCQLYIVSILFSDALYQLSLQLDIDFLEYLIYRPLGDWCFDFQRNLLGALPAVWTSIIKFVLFSLLLHLLIWPHFVFSYVLVEHLVVELLGVLLR